MIAQTIQLALAPVFMLVAIGNIMNILSTRLGRIVDRSRHLQDRHVETEGPDHDEVVREIRAIARRIHLITRAIFLLVLARILEEVEVISLAEEARFFPGPGPFEEAQAHLALARAVEGPERSRRWQRQMKRIKRNLDSYSLFLQRENPLRRCSGFCRTGS